MHPLLQGVKLVAFDLDGTLVDSVPDLAVAVDAALAELDLPPAGETKIRDWVGNGSLKLMERALQFATQASEAQGTDRRGGAFVEVDKALLESAHQAFLHHYGLAPNARTRLYPGVREVLDGLRAAGMPLGLVTNKPQAFITPILEGFGLAGHFGLCLGGDALPQKKPDPAPLLHLARHFAVAPGDCLMVGDSRHDIEAGRRAGFRTLAVPYGYNHGEPVAASRPDGLVESLAELV